jgi:hypothetical protein
MLIPKACQNEISVRLKISGISQFHSSHTGIDINNPMRIINNIMPKTDAIISDIIDSFVYFEVTHNAGLQQPKRHAPPRLTPDN